MARRRQGASKFRRFATENVEYRVGDLIRRYGRIDIEPLWSHEIRDRDTHYPDGTEKALALKMLLAGEKSQNFIRPYLKPGTVAIDVGAHLGTFSVPMMKALGPKGLLIALEPNPELAQCLSANCEKASGESRSAKFLIEQKAVSSSSGVADFWIVRTNWGIGHLDLRGQLSSSCEEMRYQSGLDGTRLVSVPVTTLDDYLHQLDKRKISFVKIDAEGNEIEGNRPGCLIIPLWELDR
jgi:FkbM family methyltransferase